MSKSEYDINTKFVISISGGKDSKTTLISVINYFINNDIPLSLLSVIYCDTGFETNNTYRELEDIKSRLEDVGVALSVLKNKKYPNGMVDLILYKKMFPTRVNKFCTTELKMRPAESYFKQLYKKGYKIINIVGKRRDESKARANIKDIEFVSKSNLKMEIWHIIADWSETDVYSFLNETWGIPKDYYQGEIRVGCNTCFQSNFKSIANLDSDRVDDFVKLERDVNLVCNADKASFFYRNNKALGGVADVRDVVKYAKDYINKIEVNTTFHQRLIIYISQKYGQKFLRYKFVQYGYVPTKEQISKWVNLKVMIPQSYLIDIENIARKVLTKKELLDCINPINDSDDSPACDCESYNDY